MKYKECIKVVGIKTVILYELLYFLEIIINLPYLFLRLLAVIISNLLELLIFVFCEDTRIKLLQVDGSDGNGYYGTVYEVIVKQKVD